MITIRLSGGLGNQLFQYAVISRLIDENETINIEYQSKTNNQHSERELSITKLRIPNNYYLVSLNYYFKKHTFLGFVSRAIRKIARVLTGEDDKGTKKINRFVFEICNTMGYCIQDAHMYYVPKRKNEMFVTGMWHSRIYVDDIREKLVKYYRLKNEYITNELKAQIETVKSSVSVAVHVRRGDYLNSTGFCTCSKEYYLRSISVLRSKLKNPVFYIFTDDINWCEDNFDDEDIVFFNGKRSDYEDFEIMRNCKHHIISNSTFSWWPAYLAEYSQKIVVCPKTWFDVSEKSWLNLPGWIQIDR